MINHYEELLTGGHPNSLGNTEMVVAEVLQDHDKFADLYDCYQSPDAVVRLRVSSAMQRICRAKPDWILGYMDKIQSEIANLDQPSAKWTLAKMFMWLDSSLTDKQTQRAIEIMKHNLETDLDWIVQNTTAESLAHFAKSDPNLRDWLIPQLHKMTSSKHNSVARRAHKLLATMK